MFPATSTAQRPIAPALLREAENMEERFPGLHVLAAREFRYPVQQHKVNLRAELYRKINLLEKFILRAYVEITPPPSREELAGALGLDPIFVMNTFNDMIELRNISNTREEGLRVTEEGRKTLSSETVSDGWEADTWYLLQDSMLDTTVFSRQPLHESGEELEDLGSHVKKDLTQFPVFDFDPGRLQTQFKKLGMDFHNPDEGRFVTEIEAAPPEICWKRIAIFVLYDALSESSDKAITVQARSEGSLIPKVGEWLESLLQEQNLSLKTLCGLSEEAVAQEEEELQGEKSPDDLLAEERLEEIRQQARSQLRLKVAGQTMGNDAGTAIQLRDVEIRPAFLKALQEAREQIIIYSPWINEQVVDDAFISLMEELVQKGVRILIGYGIGRDEHREERPIPPALRQRLRAVQTAEGTPGIIAEWLGNSHAKEIIIDRTMHFSGSHNWLSYRGDRFPRGETVYQVTIATEVEKAYNHIAYRFIEHAKTLWTRANERRVALCILCYLGYEQEAVAWLQRDKCYGLIPLWLTLARQAIAAEQEARILAALQQVIVLCGTAVELQGRLPAEMVTKIQGILHDLSPKHQQLFTYLVRNNLPEFRQM